MLWLNVVAIKHSSIIEWLEGVLVMHLQTSRMMAYVIVEGNVGI